MGSFNCKDGSTCCPLLANRVLHLRCFDGRATSNQDGVTIIVDLRGLEGGDGFFVFFEVVFDLLQEHFIAVDTAGFYLKGDFLFG